MQSITIQSSISIEQLIAIATQLPAKEKNKLRQALSVEDISKKWATLTPLSDNEPLSMDEIVAEIKTYRTEKAQN